MAQVQSILVDAVKAGSGAIASFEQARSSVAALEQLVDERFGSGESPDFSTLHALFKAVGGAIDRAKPVSEGSSDQTESESSGEPGSVQGSQAAQGLAGEIRSRDDVRRALQRVCDYLERNEPSNPAALFARRAQAMLDRNFWTLCWSYLRIPCSI